MEISALDFSSPWPGSESTASGLRGSALRKHLIVNKAVHSAVAMQPQVKHRACARQTVRMNQGNAFEIDHLDKTVQPLTESAPPRGRWRCGRTCLWSIDPWYRHFVCRVVHVGRISFQAVLGYTFRFIHSTLADWWQADKLIKTAHLLICTMSERTK